MSVDVKRGPMTPMYEVVWNGICTWLIGTAKITVLTNRIGLGILTPGKVNSWLHLCHPRIICNELVLALKEERDSRLLARTHTAENSLEDICCYKCKYELTRKEQMIIKLGVLGVKR